MFHPLADAVLPDSAASRGVRDAEGKERVMPDTAGLAVAIYADFNRQNFDPVLEHVADDATAVCVQLVGADGERVAGSGNCAALPT